MDSKIDKSSRSSSVPSSKAESNTNSDTVPPRRCLDPVVTPEASEYAEYDLSRFNITGPEASVGILALLAQDGVDDRGGRLGDKFVGCVTWYFCVIVLLLFALLVAVLAVRRGGATGGFLLVRLTEDDADALRLRASLFVLSDITDEPFRC